jgi:tetratricopeptide (TPR) repeat protein
MVLILLILGSFQAISASPEFVKLNAMIDAGQPRRAGPVLRAMLAEDPSNHEARATLGRALSVMGRCDEALVHLGAARPTTGWAGRIAEAEGSCHLRHGRLSEAAVAYEEALWMNPKLISAQHALVLLRLQQGDWSAAEEGIARIAASERKPLRAGILRVEMARAKGEDPGIDLLELERGLRGMRGKLAKHQLHFLKGKIWLDANAPELAQKAFAASIDLMPSHEGSVLGRAEALRRLGRTAEAQSAATRPILKHSVLIPPIRARILMDLGDVQGAKAKLAESTFPKHLEVVATQWYLAQATGEPTKALEQTWVEARWNRDVRLIDLIPLEAP